MSSREQRLTKFRRERQDRHQKIWRTKIYVQRILPRPLRPESARHLRLVHDEERAHRKKTLPILRLEKQLDRHRIPRKTTR